MKPTLVFQAPVATRSGYGDHSRDLLQSLYKLNKFEIKIISTRWGQTPMDALDYSNPFHKWVVDNIIPSIGQKPDVYMQMTVPNEFQPLGAYNVGITAGIETTHCALEWINGCNRMDLIIVPSEHSKRTLVDTIYSEQDKQTGRVVAQHRIEKPVEILFEGFDEIDFVNETPITITELDSVKEEFAFLFVGHWLSGDLGEDRKNVGMMIKAFAIAFKNSKIKPALILKTSTAGFSILDRERLISKIRETLGSDYSKVPVYLLHGDLTQSQMNGLYHHPKVKAMLNFTKGEGFGRPLLEFSLTGKPVIVSNWSGHLDFLKNGAVLLEGDLKEVHASAANDFLLKESKWFNVNISKSIPIIQDVYTNYANYKKNSLKLGKYNRENFSLEKMTNYFDIILNQYGIYNSKQPTFQQITLPKLKMISK
jgi:glycosyltransferase involved in cell wall biosynthesis